MPVEPGRCVVPGKSGSLALDPAQLCLILLGADKVQEETWDEDVGACAELGVWELMRDLESRAHLVQILPILPISGQHVFPELSVSCCQHHKCCFQ